MAKTTAKTGPAEATLPATETTAPATPGTAESTAPAPLTEATLPATETAAPGAAEYVVTSPLHHDGRAYAVGDAVTLAPAQARPLLGLAVRPAVAVGEDGAAG